MKTATVAAFLIVTWILIYGSPFAGEQPKVGHYYNSPELILPMTFAHLDHTSVECIDCHHNYVDDTGGDSCMHCHVTNVEVWPLLEEQFHDLCRGCHEDLAAKGEAGGPPRQCIACHVADQIP